MAFFYFIPMVVTIVCTMLISYLLGGDTIVDIFIAPIFNIFAYIPLGNIVVALYSVIFLFGILLLKILDIKIRKRTLE